MERYIEELVNIGLSDKEARVYISLIRSGTSSVYSIARNAEIKRPTTYVILDELISKGLVLKIPHARSQRFIAKSPEEFFRERERNILSFKQILPELNSVVKSRERDVKVQYYEGIQGVTEALTYRENDSEHKEIVGFFGTSKNTSQKLIDAFYQWGQRLGKKNIKLRGITPLDESTTEPVKMINDLGHEVRTVPYQTYSSNVSIDIGDTFTRIVMMQDAKAVIIENEDVAKTLREVFEMVWSK